MEKNNDVNPEIIKAFDMMWGAFPAPVMLLQKNRTIVAVNKMAGDYGMPTGGKCYELSGDAGVHDGCLANQALREGVAKRTVGYTDRLQQVQDGYWVPVQGEKDLYVHFGIDITQYAKPELFPASE